MLSLNGEKIILTFKSLQYLLTMDEIITATEHFTDQFTPFASVRVRLKSTVQTYHPLHLFTNNNPYNPIGVSFSCIIGYVNEDRIVRE